MNRPDTCDTYHCLLEVGIRTDALCGVQHGLHDGEGRKKRLALLNLDPSPKKTIRGKARDLCGRT